MRELDAFCANDVIGFRESQEPDDFTSDDVFQWYKHKAHGQTEWRVVVSHSYSNRFAPTGTPFAHSWKYFSPTVSPADAMEVLKKCHQRTEVSLRMDGKTHQVFGSNSKAPIEAETLELAICKFAKKLFSK